MVDDLILTTGSSAAIHCRSIAAKFIIHGVENPGIGRAQQIGPLVRVGGKMIMIKAGKAMPALQCTRANRR